MTSKSKDQISEPRLVVYGDTEFDETGFQLPGRGATQIRWDQIVRVAVCYEIHPVAIADWDYWAFQTDDPNLIIWVRTNAAEQSTQFSREVERRFGRIDVPPMKDWIDSNQNIRTYVIWPKADIGKSLYLTKTKHKWSLKGHLVHRNT